MIRKKYASTALILVFCVQLVFVAVSLQPYSTSTNTINSDGNLPLGPSSSDTTDSWWNYTFNHRLHVSIQEPDVYYRTNEPVEVYLEFEDGTHRIDTTRSIS